MEEKSAGRKWFCFSEGGAIEVESPAAAPARAKKPWTEAERVSSFSRAEGDGMSTAKAYALVNRLGIIEFDGENFALFKDPSLFAGRSAGGLAFCDDTPIFFMSRNFFFNDDGKKPGAAHRPFVAQFDAASHVFYPMISCENLSLGRDEEVADCVWDKNIFLCAIKKSESDKTFFSYIAVQPKLPLLSMSPSSAAKNLVVSKSSQDEYRAAKSPAPFSAAPERLAALLYPLSDSIPFVAAVRTAGGASPRFYENKTERRAESFSCEALLADTFAAAMFQDGTVYIKGSLPGRGLANRGKTCAFRLPRLPRGWVYTSFAVSGATLAAAWEETDFYETGRSGFITADLEKILYD